MATRTPVKGLEAFTIRGAMTTFKIGKKAAGRLLDGRTWDGVPT